MPTQVVLLRGINVGPNNRIPMPALRAALEAAGFENVRTYVQSGNIVLDSALYEATLAARVAELIAAEFGLNIAVVVRDAESLADAVSRNPFPDQALENPKVLLVTFRSSDADPARVAALEHRAAPNERVAASGRELYTWHPDGIARSKMALGLTGAGEAATARNWRTVTTLLEMASGGEA
jgi:uncharacterized protein (DUF1697 family)